MDDLQSKMYNYETTPPAGVWEAIASQLDGNEAKVISLKNTTNKRLFYYLAAASVTVIICCFIFFTHRTTKAGNEGFFSLSSDKQINNNNSSNTFGDTAASAKNDDVIITVPQQETNVENDSDEEITAKNTLPVKGGPHERIKNDEVKNTDSSDKTTDKNANKKITASNSASSYITIEGPQGQPVKVSTKMALLIDSSDNKVPPKPNWNKKINEWREIMKGNTLAPTPGNFLDIIELTKTLKDNKKP